MIERARDIRLAAMLLVVVFLLAVAACGKEERLGSDAGSASSPTSDAATPEVQAEIEPTNTLVMEATPEPSSPMTPTGSTSTDPEPDPASPDTGMGEPYGLTLEEVQALVPFDIVLPDPLPAGLTFTDAEGPSDDAADGANPDVILSYSVASDPGYPSVILGESVEQLDFETGFGPGNVMSVRGELMFGETPVTQRSLTSQGCIEFMFYDWELDGLFSSRPPSRP